MPAEGEGYYDHYVTRSRNGLGVRIKKGLAERMVALANLPPTGAVFELGPGDGDIAEIVTRRGLAYSALDASASIAANLSKKGLQVSQGFAPPIPEGLPMLEAVFAMHVIEHMTPNDAQEFLMQVRDRLSPTGRLVIATPDYARWGRHFYDSDYTHINPYTARKLKQSIENAGLEVAHEGLHVGPVFGYAGVPFAWLAKLFYTATVQDVLRKLSGNDLPGRAFLTVLPNLVFVASKGSGH